MSGMDISTNTTVGGETFIILWALAMLIGGVLSLVYLISLWKVFKKANKPGWAAIVPIYNYIVMLDIAQMNIVYLLLFFIPGANIIATILVFINIAKRFGKSTGFGIGMALFGIVFIPLLAFSDSKLDGVDSNTTNSNNFNAMNVINSNEEKNETIVNSSGIPTIENANIEVDNGTVQNTNIETEQVEPEINVVPDQIDQNIETKDQEEVNAFNMGTPNIDTATEQPTEEPATFEPETIETVNVEEPVVPTEESTPVQNEPVGQTVESEPAVNAFNMGTPNIDTAIEQPTEEPATFEPETIETVNVEEPVVPTEESTPVQNEPTGQTVESEPTVNAFNMTPQINEEPKNESIDTLDSEQNVDVLDTNTTQNQESSDTKICKSCGTEMPKIVSICPNCGTENE